ncbi:MAG: DNRLRE domain-containing protein [Saprospiraceae bacterium]|nr:DNRLRE domain-containing protein [Saprospiraceae bacterium]
MKKISISLFLIIFYVITGLTQSVLTLQPDPSSGKDAIIHGLASQRNLNFGTNQQFVANAWTFSGEEAQIRSVIDFDISSIPVTSTILSAYLQLYAWDSNSGMGQHSTEDGENTCVLQRITSDWNEQTITWNNQPTTTVTNQVEIPYSYYPTQNFILDVTKLIADKKNNPNQSFGFMIKLKNEI